MSYGWNPNVKRVIYSWFLKNQPNWCNLVVIWLQYPCWSIWWWCNDTFVDTQYVQCIPSQFYGLKTTPSHQGVLHNLNRKLRVSKTHVLYFFTMFGYSMGKQSEKPRKLVLIYNRNTCWNRVNDCVNDLESELSRVFAHYGDLI